jgi:hypothetical protein
MPKSTTLLVAATLALLLLVAVAALRIRLRNRGGDAAAPWPFFVRRPLTQPEQVLYHRLVAALPGHMVLSQVQVSRVLGVCKGTPQPRAWLNRINQLSYDFVVCSPDATVLAAIELDDSTHSRPDRVSADDRKDRASAGAGLRLIRWHVRDLPDAAAIAAAMIAPKNPDRATEIAGRREPTL